MRTAVRDEYFVRVDGRNAETHVVARAADESAVPAHDLPRPPAIVGAPEGALISRLNESVDAIGVGGRDSDIDLADRRLRKSGVGHTGPRGASVARHVETTAWSTTEHRP